jgi:DNA repair protein RecN (Recombination protein N)
MLAELNISNLAIIEQLNLKFAPGFNALTGETGAGKSIIIDAVGLLLGSRAQTDLIRAGADQTTVEGIFVLSAMARELLSPQLEEFGLGLEDDALILTRELHRAGRNVCRVNNRAVTLSVLQQIGDRMVDIHGQSEHLSLLRVREHIDFLDHYGNLWVERAALAKQVRALRKLRQELRDLQKDARETARRIDRLTFVVEEIGAAKLKPGEEEALKEERDLLGNAEERANLADQAYRDLYGEGEEIKGALDFLAEAGQALVALEKYDPTIKPGIEQSETIQALLDDLTRTLRTYRDNIEFNPDRLAQVEERLDLIFRLKRKYGESIEEILKFAQGSAEELAVITHSEERISELREQEGRLLRDLGIQAEGLSMARHEAAGRLSIEIERELKDLGMEKAKFGVALDRGEEANGLIVGNTRLAFDSTGIDRVEFLVSPNPGEPLKPLAKIASGGETSRLMLAMKAVLGAADRTPTLIFDEIDQGIGGRTGGVVGRKLWGLTAAKNGAYTHQVICVTHLPQIASYGDAHFHIRKQIVGNRTITLVSELKAGQRVDELAQMLGMATETTRRGAQEMLVEVERNKLVAQEAKS